MLEDEKNNSEKNISLGLAASDADDYKVNSGETPAAEETGSKAKKKKRRPLDLKLPAAFAAGFLCCLAAAFLLVNVIGLGRFVSRARYEYLSELDSAYGKYYEIMKLIGEDPIAESEAGSISDDELKKIVANTGDPYAEYFTSEEYEEFIKRYDGDYVGIGVGVVDEDGKIVVKTVFEDTPAEEAGIREGDVIAEIDGKKPENVDDTISMISGEAGSKIVIAVERDGERLEISTYRAKIDSASVSYSPLDEDPGIGYIVIVSFKKDTSDEFKLAVRDLKAEGCDRFIIDLRGNGGGLTDESLEIADYLLPACRIMSEVKKNGNEKVYNSKASSAELDCVVLVDEDTASASEILTAALQDNKGATVIGKPTYGKGVTQITRRFSDGSALKITSTEYFRPNGGKVDGVGITPDIEAEGEELLDAALKELDK